MGKTLAELNTAILAVCEDDGTVFSGTTTALKEALREYSDYSPWETTSLPSLVALAPTDDSI